MHSELSQLGAALCRPRIAESVPATDIETAAARAVVVIPAGGFGFRMRGAVAGQESVTQKSLLRGPDGETLIARVVRQYAEAGVRRFVALVNHAGQEVERHLEGGRPWGVDVRCSYDPESGGSGRTGAMIQAMDLGIMPADALAVVHNADCQVVRYTGNFAHDLLAAHLGATPGTVATLAAVNGSPYPFTGMQILDGRVAAVEMYPFIPVPTHTGITVLTPAALSQLRERHAESKKNFEQDLFPRWAAAGTLAAMVIPSEQWVAVDDAKAYRQYAAAITAPQG